MIWHNLSPLLNESYFHASPSGTTTVEMINYKPLYLVFLSFISIFFLHISIFPYLKHIKSFFRGCHFGREKNFWCSFFVFASIKKVALLISYCLLIQKTLCFQISQNVKHIFDCFFTPRFQDLTKISSWDYVAFKSVWFFDISPNVDAYLQLQPHYIG